MDRCECLVHLILAAVDGTLDRDKREQMALHLAGCPACRQAVNDQERVRRLLAELPFPEVSQDFVERVRARIAAPAWFDVADWRVWTLRLAPVAAVLLVALMWGVTETSRAQSLSSVLEAWAADGATTTERQLLLDPTLTADTLLAAALEERPR